SRGAIVRTIYESLAWNYRTVLEKLARHAGHKIETLHIVGGGCRDNLLNQYTADATGCRVIAGPEEGTAMGNALMQLIALGELKGISEGRRIVSNSVQTKTYESQDAARWNDQVIIRNNV
ncbi:MAG: hypothetical protein LBV12_10150, partial [Puniceicoccales bacterium]|nr:hypothetical protein [Puniceicoccales bacterium]